MHGALTPIEPHSLLVLKVPLNTNQPWVLRALHAAQQCLYKTRLRNDLYCVEWDVKLYYTIPCLYKNCPEMIEKNMWTSNNSPNFEYHIMSGERRTKQFFNLQPKTKTVSELKDALEKMWDNFPQVQLTKLCRLLDRI